MVNDTIADMLTHIRNANLAKHKVARVKATKMTRCIAGVLKEEGLIHNFEEIQNSDIKNELLISLKYKGKKRQPIITALKRISKPGLRVYANHKELPRVLGGLGIAILSTSSGIMTDQAARRKGCGGEVLCYIW